MDFFNNFILQTAIFSQKLLNLCLRERFLNRKFRLFCFYLTRTDNLWWFILRDFYGDFDQELAHLHFTQSCVKFHFFIALFAVFTASSEKE